jgi:hypothetical protein
MAKGYLDKDQRSLGRKPLSHDLTRIARLGRRHDLMAQLLLLRFTAGFGAREKS